jgi:hypothetical protein
VKSKSMRNRAMPDGAARCEIQGGHIQRLDQHATENPADEKYSGEASLKQRETIESIASIGLW